MPVNAFFARSDADRFDFALDSLVLDRFNYRSFMLDHLLELSRLSAFGGGIGVYGNPNGKLQKTDRLMTFPHYIIRSLATHFAVDTLDVSDFLVSYSELNHKDGKTGLIEFKATKARFLHISNMAAKIKSQPVCKATLSTLLEGRGKLDLSLDFNLTDKVYAYDYQGHLSAMPLVALNPVVMPLGQVRIKSGELKSLDFSVQADQAKSKGTLHLLYNDLAVDVLKPDYKTKVLKTLAVKVFVIKRENPDTAGAQPRFAKIVFLRPKSYPFFRTLWETLFSGIKPCAGVGYAAKKDPPKPVSKKEQRAKKKALKKAIRAKKKADKQFQKKLRSS